MQNTKEEWVNRVTQNTEEKFSNNKEYAGLYNENKAEIEKDVSELFDRLQEKEANKTFQDIQQDIRRPLRDTLNEIDDIKESIKNTTDPEESKKLRVELIKLTAKSLMIHEIFDSAHRFLSVAPIPQPIKQELTKQKSRFSFRNKSQAETRRSSEIFDPAQQTPSSAPATPKSNRKNPSLARQATENAARKAEAKAKVEPEAKENQEEEIKLSGDRERELESIMSRIYNAAPTAEELARVGPKVAEEMAKVVAEVQAKVKAEVEARAEEEAMQVLDEVAEPEAKENEEESIEPTAEELAEVKAEVEARAKEEAMQVLDEVAEPEAKENEEESIEPTAEELAAVKAEVEARAKEEAEAKAGPKAPEPVAKSPAAVKSESRVSVNWKRVDAQGGPRDFTSPAMLRKVRNTVATAEQKKEAETQAKITPNDPKK